MIRFLIYLGRWQLSTPILAGVIYILSFDYITEAIIANLVGGILLYKVDQKIFNRKKGNENEEK